MNDSRVPRSRITVEELVALFGERLTKRLIFHCAGRRVPTCEQYLKAMRRRMVTTISPSSCRRPSVACSIIFVLDAPSAT